MVHRDIKPDNIALVDAPDGEMVKVLDFGIAKMKEARMGETAGLTLTGAGVVIGTPQYMSPEQAMGKRGDELDGRADLYSLGVVMYQMLTADLPFKADTTMEMLLAHMQKAPMPIPTAHPELQVPENVAALALRLLEKNRDLRPATARALIQEIDKLEKELADPGATRFVPPDELKGPAANRGPLASRSSAGLAVPPQPKTPPARSTQTPRPEQPAAGRSQIRAVAPPMTPPKPAESRWGIWAALVVLLLGIGGGGLYIYERTSSAPPLAPTPVLSATLTADPPSIEKGKSVTLHWSSQNATDLDLQPGVGKVEAEGSKVITPQDSTTYTLKAIGPGGTQTPQAHVNVAAPPVPPPSPPPSKELTSKPARPDRKTKASPKTEAPAVARITEPPKPTPPPAQPEVAPQKTKAQLSLATFFLGHGEYDEAIGALQEGLKIDPSNAEMRKKLEETIRACTTERKALGGEL